MLKYGLSWSNASPPLFIELEMLRKGGRFKKKDGHWAGEGMLFHFTEAVKLAFPTIVLHRWNRMFFEHYLLNRTIGALGPAASGKTNSAAVCVLMDYFIFPMHTTVICCSTTKEMLENRIFGELKKLHRVAKALHPWLPGNLIEGRLRIVTDDRNSTSEGRDFRNGIIGVPCKKGDAYVGLGDFAGIHNKRVRLVGDELSLLPKVFVDAISNLDKCPDFKAIGIGNPKDTTDALGVFCEPNKGWESGIDQEPGTKFWPTKRPDGVCLQFPGSDSPNLSGTLGAPLITQEQINRDVEQWGRDSLHFTMMNEGKMPRGQGTRRVLTRQMCENHHAKDAPNWKGGTRTKIAFLDAAYGGVGGDRCVFGTLEFGEETIIPLLEPMPNVISQSVLAPSGKKILALTSMMLVPIVNAATESPEDQITLFCKKQCDNNGIVPANFFFDSGMRTSLVSSMGRLWSTAVCPIDCGGTPTLRQVSESIRKACKDHYSKFITELWFSVRLIVEAGQFRGMTEEVMMEGCSREWTMVGANKIEVETKADMKLKTGRSPDHFDALCMGVEGARQRGFVIMGASAVRMSDNPTARDNWKQDLENRMARVWKSGVLDHAA